jgi:hypothetical protein
MRRCRVRGVRGGVCTKSLMILCVIALSGVSWRSQSKRKGLYYIEALSEFASYCDPSRHAPVF